jgi:hypothetical protein
VKRTLIVMLLLMGSIFSFAQSRQEQTIGNPLNEVRVRGALSADSLIKLPYGDTTARPLKPAFVTRTADSTLYYWNLVKWSPISKAAFVDTVYKRNDSLLYRIKGVEKYVGKFSALASLSMPGGFVVTNTSGAVSVTTALSGPVAVSAGSFINPVLDSPLLYQNDTLRIKKADATHSGYLNWADWVAFNNKVPSTRSVFTTGSLTGGGDLSTNRTFSLVNDVTAPGNYYNYGTNGAGVKGWYPNTNIQSIGLTVPTGFSVTGSPLTSSGTLGITTTLNGMVYANGSGFQAVNVLSPLVFDAGTLSLTIPPASSTQNGYMTSTVYNQVQTAASKYPTGINVTGTGTKTVQLTLSDGSQLTASWSDLTGAGAGSGVTSINGDNSVAQTITSGTTGTDFSVSTSGGVTTLNLPFASATATGKISAANWSSFNSKIGPSDTAAMLNPYARKADYYSSVQMQTSGAAQLHWNNITNLPNAGSFIYNQNATSQTGNFKISGDGTLGGKVTAQRGLFNSSVNTPAAQWIQYQLTAAGDNGSDNGFAMLNASSVASTRPVVLGQRARGTLDAPLAVQDGDWLFGIVAGGFDANNNRQTPAAIEFKADGTPGAGTVPARIEFETGTYGGDRVSRLTVDNLGVKMPNLATGLTAPTTSGTTKMVVTDANGRLSFQNIPTAGIASITADNGLTANTSSNVRLGGTLVQDAIINAGSAYKLSVTSSATSGNKALEVNNTSSGYGITSSSTSGAGVFASSSSGYGLIAYSASGVPAKFQTTPVSTSTAIEVLSIERGSTATPTDGIGGYISFRNARTDNQLTEANRVLSKWTNATNGTQTSQFEIWGVNSSSMARRLAIKGSGQLQLDNYIALSSFPGTAVASLGVDASGNVITITGTGGGTVTTPAGAPTQVQFNSMGNFGASSSFTWDSTINRLNITGSQYNQRVSTPANLGAYAIASAQTLNWNTPLIAQGSGYSYDASSAFLDNNFSANQTLSAASIHSANINVVRVSSDATATVNVAQAGAGSRRALSANAVAVQLNQTNTGVATTIDHVAGMQIYAIQSTSTAVTQMPNITNYYGLLIGDGGEYSNVTSHIANRYGIYQTGNTDSNYFAGPIRSVRLAGTGTRMVVADAAGIVSTQAIPTGGTGGSATDLSLGTATATTRVINSSTGLGVTMPAATATTAGLMPASLFDQAGKGFYMRNALLGDTIFRSVNDSQFIFKGITLTAGSNITLTKNVTDTTLGWTINSTATGSTGTAVETAATFASMDTSSAKRLVYVTADETNSGKRTLYMHGGDSLMRITTTVVAKPVPAAPYSVERTWKLKMANQYLSPTGISTWATLPATADNTIPAGTTWTALRDNTNVSTGGIGFVATSGFTGSGGSIGTNGGTANGGIFCSDQLTMHGWTSTATTTTFKITGLTAGKYYQIGIFSNTENYMGNTQSATAPGGSLATWATGNNYGACSTGTEDLDDPAIKWIYNNTPTSGEITITLTKVAGTYAAVNALIVQQSSVAHP